MQLKLKRPRIEFVLQSFLKCKNDYVDEDDYAGYAKLNVNNDN